MRANGLAKQSPESQVSVDDYLVVNHIGLHKMCTRVRTYKYVIGTQ